MAGPAEGMNSLAAILKVLDAEADGSESADDGQIAVLKAALGLNKQSA